VAALKLIIRRILRLAPCILASTILPILPAQADITMEMRPPQVSKFVVTCEYVNGVVSPLQIHIAEKRLSLSPYEITITNVQSGLSRTVVPTRSAFVSDVGIFPIPSLQPGIYDVRVSWRKGFPEPLEKPDKGMFFFKGLKIPNITSTGGRGTGCQV
jgi:hypothetical protein